MKRSKTPDELVPVLRHALLDADQFRAACEVLHVAQQVAILSSHIDAMKQPLRCQLLKAERDQRTLLTCLTKACSKLGLTVAAVPFDGEMK